jgi:predicted AAA+ superfamily ATPase
LGVAVNRKQFSFPVGKVDIKTLYPMDMEEFLLAFGEKELISQIKECFDNNTPMPSALHEAALAYYRKYLVVGGMPDCVSKYLQTGDFILVRHAQDMVLAGYLNDMSKYNSQNEIKKTRLVYDNITVQLSKKNTRFQYKLIKKGARASEFENAIEWLVLSGIATRIYRVEHPKKPLENYKDINSFKTYVSDVGLLCAKRILLPKMCFTFQGSWTISKEAWRKTTFAASLSQTDTKAITGHQNAAQRWILLFSVKKK